MIVSSGQLASLTGQFGMIVIFVLFRYCFIVFVKTCSFISPIPPCYGMEDHFPSRTPRILPWSVLGFSILEWPYSYSLLSKQHKILLFCFAIKSTPDSSICLEYKKCQSSKAGILLHYNPKSCVPQDTVDIQIVLGLANVMVLMNNPNVI